MNYLRTACGVSRLDGESNESVYNRFGMTSKGEGMKCGVVEGVKRSTLRWFGHMERMDECEMTKRVYMSKIDAVGVRGKTPNWVGRQSGGVYE